MTPGPKAKLVSKWRARGGRRRLFGLLPCSLRAHLGPFDVTRPWIPSQNGYRTFYRFQPRVTGSTLYTMRNPATSTPLTMEEVGNLDALRVRATSCASSPMNSSDCSARSGPSVRETSRAPRRACERSAPGLRFWICWRGRRFGPRRPTTRWLVSTVRGGPGPP